MRPPSEWADLRWWMSAASDPRVMPQHDDVTACPLDAILAVALA